LKKDYPGHHLGQTENLVAVFLLGYMKKKKRKVFQKLKTVIRPETEFRISTGTMKQILRNFVAHEL
jgi:hypothetical protein